MSFDTWCAQDSCTMGSLCESCQRHVISELTRLLRVEDDAKRFQWLVETNPHFLSAIAYQVPAACSVPYNQPRQAIDAAMQSEGFGVWL